MICDLRSPSSVYCCNRREVVSVRPLRLCRRDAARPHQAPPPAHRSVRPQPGPHPAAPASVLGPQWRVLTVFVKSLYLRIYWKFCLNNLRFGFTCFCMFKKSAYCMFQGSGALCKFMVRRKGKSLPAACGHTRLPLCLRDFATDVVGEAGGPACSQMRPLPSASPTYFLTHSCLLSWLSVYPQPLPPFFQLLLGPPNHLTL